MCHFPSISLVFKHRAKGRSARKTNRKNTRRDSGAFLGTLSRQPCRSLCTPSEGHTPSWNTEISNKLLATRLVSTHVRERRVRNELTTPSATDSRDRRGETEKRQRRAHARHAYSFEPSQSRSDSLSVAPATYIVAHMLSLLSLSRFQSVSLARHTTAHRFSISSAVPSFIENPYLLSKKQWNRRLFAPFKLPVRHTWMKIHEIYVCFLYF